MGEEAKSIGNIEAAVAQFDARLEENPRTGPVLWTDCEDIEVFDDLGRSLYAGPRYFRCLRAECRLLVTHGMIAEGGCWCGNRRLGVALRLTAAEAERLKSGYYPLRHWEAMQIQPCLPPGKLPGWGKAEDAQRYA